MKNKILYDVNDIQKLLGVKECKAYEIIRKLNSELEKKNYITIRGKVPIAYFRERFYGAKETA